MQLIPNRDLLTHAFLGYCRNVVRTDSLHRAELNQVETVPQLRTITTENHLSDLTRVDLLFVVDLSFIIP